MKYSIIVLNRNGLTYVERFFDSLSLTVGERDDCEVVFVDNGSDDGSLEFARGYDKIPTTVITNKENVSFSAGNNQGVRESRGEYLIFANNDLVFAKNDRFGDWIEALQSAFDEKSSSNRNVGCVGAKLLYPSAAKHKFAGKVQHAGIVFGRDHTDQFFAPRAFGQGRESHLFAGVDTFYAVTAALLFVARENFDLVQGFDEEYYYNYEDVDLCLRLGEEGYMHIVQNDLTIYHHESVSQKKHWSDEHGSKVHDSALYFKKLWNEKIFNLMYSEDSDHDIHVAQEDLYDHLISAENALKESVEKNEKILYENHLLEKKIQEREGSLSPGVLKVGNVVTNFQHILSKVVFAIFHPLAMIKKYLIKK